jgi:plastocyanin
VNAATGVVSGMPNSAGTFTFTITATDDLGFAGARAYTLTVAMPTLTLTSAAGNGAVGSPYSAAIGVTGGTAPYVFAVSAGQLPAGLTLNASTGALTGVPTTAGSYSFTLAVTDANGATGSFTVTIDVAPRPDPTQDPTVRGLSGAQVSAASRFGSAQIGNLNARMQMLRLGHDPCATHIDIGTNIEWKRTKDAADATTKEEPVEGKNERKSGCDREFAVWAGGNVDFGFLWPSSSASRSVLGFTYCLFYSSNIISVFYFQDLPAVSIKSFADILSECNIRISFNSNIVGIIKKYKLTKTQSTCK